MIKKESAKRGYMTSEEVREKIDGYTSIDKKINYLKHIIHNKQSLMSKGTRRSVYDTLQNLYLEDGNLKDAERTAVEGGLSLNKVRHAYGMEAQKIHEEMSHSSNWREKNSILAWSVAPLSLEGEALLKSDKPEKGRKFYENLSIESSKNGDLIEQNSNQIKEKVAGEDERTKKFMGAGTPDNPLTGIMSGEDVFPYARSFEDFAKEKYGFGNSEEAYIFAAQCLIRIGETDKAIRLLKEKDCYADYVWKHLVRDVKTRTSLREIKYQEGARELFKERKHKNTLEKKVLVSISLAGFITSIFLLSSNITGNAIANLSKNSSNFIGASLFAIGIISGFFWLKNKDKK